MIIRFNWKSMVGTLMIAILPMLMSYCSKEEYIAKKGEVNFGFNSSHLSGRTKAIGTPAFIKYVFVNAAGDITSDKVAVYPLGSSYVSDRQTFSVGVYTLQEYFILNASNETIFAAVVAGAPLANLVSQTLPFQFEVSEEQTALVAPDVVPVSDDASPADFGYVKWSYNLAAKFVKFVLPVQSQLISNFKSGALTITQGSYIHTEPLKGSPGTQLYVEMLVKTNQPLTVSLKVDAEDIYIDSYRFEPESDLLDRESISQMELTKSFGSIQGTEFTFPEFNHKIGRGWSFKFAEIKSYAKNGSWIKLRYQGNELCEPLVEVATNANAFDFEKENSNGISLMKTDKLIWSQPAYYYNPNSNSTEIYNPAKIIGGVASEFNTQPVCSNGICLLMADLSNSANYYSSTHYAPFISACSANEWVMFDALTWVTTIHNGQTNSFSAYFMIEKVIENTSTGGRINSNGLVSSNSEGNDLIRR